MTLSLPDRPAKHFINKVLVPNWPTATAKGYDLSVTDPSNEAFLPVSTTIDDVGAVYPSLIISYSNETSGGETTYDYVTPSGPGQNRQGTLLATVRAQDVGGGYTGDSGTYSAQPADDIVHHIVEAVEEVCQSQATGGSSDFQTIGSQRGPDAPDDQDTDPTTRIGNCQILYSWLRSP